MNTLIQYVLGFGGLADIALLIKKFFGGEIDLKKLVHDLFQKKGVETIDEIEHKQSEVKKTILENEKVPEEVKEKIKEIKDNANKEVVKIIQENNLETLLNEADKLW